MKRAVVVFFCLLVSCSVLFGELVYEDEQEFAPETEFVFSLPANATEYKVNIQFAYQGTFDCTLTDPDGETQSRTMRIRNPKRKRSQHAWIEKNVFRVVPKEGTYTLHIEEQGHSFRGRTVKLKIYR